jgi:hypothetical protein
MSKIVSILVMLLIANWSISDPAKVFAQVHVGPGQKYPDLGTASHLRAIKAGDTVYLHAGTYTNSTYWIDSLLGTSDKRITIRPFENDSVSIEEQYTFHCAQYVRITGLHFFGNNPTQSSRVFHLLLFDYSYECFTLNHDVIIDSCTFRDLNNAGKGSTGAYLKLTGTDNFQILDCTFRGGTNITDGISLNSDRNGVVRGCTFENIPGDGSHCKGGAKNITYEKNLFINCAAGGLDVGGDTGAQFLCPIDATWEADSIKVYSNIFIGGSVGIKLSDCHNSFIVNNTCFKSTSFAFRSLNASSRGVVLENNHIYNNIFTTFSTNRIYMNASAGFDYSTEYFKSNLFHDYKNPDPQQINWGEMPGVNVSGSIIDDPMFADTLQKDFSLLPSSPAIGAGTKLTEPVTDFEEKPYSTIARSIGALEVEQPKRVAYDGHVTDFSIDPNPSSGRVTIRTLRVIDAHLTVRDLLGRIVYEAPLYEADHLLDLTTMPNGIYYLTLKDNTLSATKQLLITR